MKNFKCINCNTEFIEPEFRKIGGICSVCKGTVFQRTKATGDMSEIVIDNIINEEKDFYEEV